MSLGLGLGRLYNYRHVADGGYVSLRSAGAVDFLCYLTGGAGDTYTVQEAKDASGTGAQNLAVITTYWTCTGDGSDAWTKRTQAAGAAVTTAAAAIQNAACFCIDADQLSAGYTYVKCTSTGAGLVTALVHDLIVQRAPQNLKALGV